VSNFIFIRLGASVSRSWLYDARMTGAEFGLADSSVLFVCSLVGCVILFMIFWSWRRFWVLVVCFRVSLRVVRRAV